ncbi:MAG: MFS family permease/MFS family permease [Chloroflexi bacterium]|nr:MAG: MFS family permease/MFS family permease [Chloroflexota bacterium]
MEADMQWARNDITRVLSLGIFVGALSFIVMGYLYDKYGGRRVISAALIMVGISVFLLSRVNSIFGLILIYGILGSFASSGASFVTIHSLLAKWFYRRRSLAMSLSAAGGSIGPFLFAPFCAFLIEAFDWRIAFLFIGGMVLFIGAPLAALFLRDDPLGQIPDSERDETGVQDKEEVQVEMEGPLFTNRWKQALSTSPFWQLSAAYLVCGITTNIIAVHFVPFAEDQGVPRITAAMIFGIMMMLNSVGVISAGVLSQKFSQHRVLGFTYALRGIAYLALLTIGGTTGMWAFALIAGMSWIATASVTSSLVADIYGVRNLGTLNGMSNMVHQIGGAVSVLVAGELQAVTGSYEIPFAIAGATLLFASIAAFSVKEKKYSYRYSTVPVAAVSS